MPAAASATASVSILAVVVVNKQMPWDGLSWGQWTLEDPGREVALTSTHGRTRARTQVQGSPIEIKPLLMHLECISLWIRATKAP